MEQKQLAHPMLRPRSDPVMSSSAPSTGSRSRSPLLESARQALLLRHYSPKTVEAYVGWGRRSQRPLASLGPVVHAKHPARLPVVMTRAEVHFNAR